MVVGLARLAPAPVFLPPAANPKAPRTTCRVSSGRRPTNSAITIELEEPGATKKQKQRGVIRSQRQSTSRWLLTSRPNRESRLDVVIAVWVISLY